MDHPFYHSLPGLSMDGQRSCSDILYRAHGVKFLTIIIKHETIFCCDTDPLYSVHFML